MKKILFINCSPRENGNSNFLLDCLTNYYKQFDYKVDSLDLTKIELSGCNACGYCKKNGKCVKDDLTTDLLDTMYDYDLVIMFCPVYFCGFDSHTKMLIDRAESIYNNNKKIHGKIALVVSFGATSEENYLGMHYGMKYFSKAIAKEYVGVKPFGNTDNLTEKLKEDFKNQIIDFVEDLL